MHWITWVDIIIIIEMIAFAILIIKILFFTHIGSHMLIIVQILHLLR